MFNKNIIVIELFSSAVFDVITINRIKYLISLTAHFRLMLLFYCSAKHFKLFQTWYK